VAGALSKRRGDGKYCLGSYSSISANHDFTCHPRPTLRCTLGLPTPLQNINSEDGNSEFTETLENLQHFKRLISGSRSHTLEDNFHQERIQTSYYQNEAYNALKNIKKQRI
jgi:hypothetical protein